MNLADAWNEVKSLWPDGRYVSVEARLCRSLCDDELIWELYVTAGDGIGRRRAEARTLNELVTLARSWAELDGSVAQQCVLIDGIEENSLPDAPGSTIEDSGNAGYDSQLVNNPARTNDRVKTPSPTSMPTSVPRTKDEQTDA